MMPGWTKIFLFLFGIIFLTLQSLVQSAAVLSPTEYSSLWDLYDSTHGPSWRWRDESHGKVWVFGNDTDPCGQQWQGISCSSVPDEDNELHITELQLPAYRMRGKLPASIGNFSHLRTLDVAGNIINDVLPSSIGGLVKLEYLLIGTNTIFHTLPDTLSNLQSLRVLDVNNNQFTGTIPELVCSLPQLQRFHASLNHFYGTIPDCIGTSLTNLTLLALADLRLTGQFPVSLTSLPNLLFLNLEYNSLTGTLPEQLGSMVQLQVLCLQVNNFRGSIPDAITQMASLVHLNLSINQLNGTIPANIGALTQLQTLDLSENEISGTLPSSFAELTQLYITVFYTNNLTGPIPQEPCALGNLTDVDLGSNRFTGTIPDCYGDLSQLRRLFMDVNMLTSTVPEALCQLTDLHKLYLRQNKLEGTLPPCIGDLTKMQELYLYVNYFAGTVPMEWQALDHLSYLDIGDNYLHGPLPMFQSANHTLQYYYANHNHFSGSIPEEMGSLPNLLALLLQGNYLSGALPEQLSELGQLVVLNLEYNYLSGSLQGVFNATTQHLMTTLKINNNEFTGTLPAEIFQLPSLHNFAGASNCLDTVLPEAICNSSSLVTLSLDGLHTATTCRRLILPGISRAYTPLRRYDRPILSCLFHLPKLITLHLSGNSLTGTIPDVDVLTMPLLDLALSHNKLRGDIPTQFQQKRWYQLDLSYNRLTGTLRSDFGTVASELTDDDAIESFNATGELDTYILSLEDNRISGRIPQKVQQLTDVSILGSNLFSCNLMHTNLPEHDTEASKYSCGSSSFDVPYYVWLSITAAALVAAAVAGWYFRAHPTVSDVISRLQRWHGAANGISGRGVSDLHILHVALLSRMTTDLCTTALKCAAYILAVLLPLYVGLSLHYSVMTHQYSYTVSSAFLSGRLPAAMEFVALILLLCLFLACFMTRIERYDIYIRETNSLLKLQKRPSRPSQDVQRKRAIWLRNAAIYVAFETLNLVIVVNVNLAYVYVVVYESASLLLWAQIIIAIFKFLWNGIGAYYLVKWTRKSLYMEEEQRTSPDLEMRFIVLQVANALLNNIIIPCCVVAVVSPSCFYNAFFSAPEVSTPYTYALSSGVRGLEKTVIYSIDVYQPSFQYNYQCSSSIITSYAPAYVVLCIIAGCVIPLLEFGARHMRSKFTEGSFCYQALDIFVPYLLNSVETMPVANKSKHFAHFSCVLVTLISFMGLLLTFGALFPPLGLTLAVTILSITCMHHLRVGRFLCAALNKGRMDIVEALEEEARRVGSAKVLRISSWMLVIIGCVFYTLCIFDTLADDESAAQAFWVIVVMPLMAVVLYAGYWVVQEVYRYKRRKQQELREASSQNAEERVDSVEMSISKRPTLQVGMGMGMEEGREGSEVMNAEEEAAVYKLVQEVHNVLRGESRARGSSVV